MRPGWFCLLLAMLAVGLASAADDCGWRDALLGLRTDATGAVWNFQENGELGRVGASAVNRGQMLLIDGAAFAAQSAFMSGNGNEFLVSGLAGSAQASLVAVRRIWLDAAAGVVLYAELLRNEGREERRVQVEIRTNLNGYYQRFQSNQGREMPVDLREGETGYWLSPGGAKEGGRGFAFTLCGPEAPLRPVLGSKQSYVVSAYFELEIAPGETAALLHAVRQAPLEAGEDAARLAEVFAPLNLERLREKLPPAIRQALRNCATPGTAAASRFFRGLPAPVFAGAETLVALDGGELRGKLLPGTLQLETPRGRAEVAGEDLVAAVCREPGKREVSLWLRGGELLQGAVAEGDLRFALTGGAAPAPEIALRWEALRSLRRGGDQQVDRGAAWVGTAAGEQLRLGAGWEAVLVRWETAYGPVERKLGEVSRLEGPEPMRLCLPDGSSVTLSGTATGSLPLGGRWEGRQLPASEVRRFWRPAVQTGSADWALGGAGAVETESGDRLVWSKPGETLELETSQGRLALPLSEVRRMERRGDGFEVTLWNGSRFPVLRPAENFACAGQAVWRIPWSRIRVLESAPGGAAAARGAELEKAVEKLRADDWKTRHEAEMALRALGELAAPRLRQLREQGDADFRHRLTLLLEELESSHAGHP